MSVRLVSRYRPTTFREVVGQPETVRFLGTLIRRDKIRKHILFHGNVGSGKTTLAKLYAKALFCKSPSIVDGSPCNCCDQCEQFGQGLCEYYEIDAPNQDEQQLKAKLELFGRYLPASGPCFVFFDEAHALANLRTIFDSLLKRMEDDEGKIVYCFATTDVERIPAALRSRVVTFEIKALTTTAAVSYMEKIAMEVGIKAEREALVALAGLARGQVRDLLQRMDQLRDIGITLDNVQTVFGISYTVSLTAYFEALASGDRKAQMTTFLEWNSEVRDKLRVIQQFITAIYFLDVHSLDVVLDPVVASIPQRIRAPIVAAFRKRLDKLGLGFESFWRGVLSFWPVVSAQTDAAIMMRLAQFHDFVCAPDKFDAWGRLADVMPMPQAALKKTQVRRRKIPADPSRLSRSVVEEIVDRAAFCTQHYGKQFNARITLWHKAFTDQSSEAISKRVSEFGHHWKEWVRRREPHQVPLRLSLQEIDKERGPCLRIIVHFPEGQENEAETWCRTWKQKERSASTEINAVDVEKKLFAATALVRRSRWHRDNVLWLCGGIRPEEIGWDPVDQTDRSLARLLEIPALYLRTIGDFGGANRLTASKALQPQKMVEAQENKMPIVSAFRMQKWKEIACAWELDEFRDRVATIEQRRREVDDLRSAVAPAMFESKRQELIDSWSEDPCKRQRSYAAWWHTSQL